MPFDERLAERIRHLLADRADSHEKKMMGGIAFMVKGGMCCAASGRGGLLVRVRPEEQPALLAPPQVAAMVMGGRAVKTFVRVSPEAYRTPSALKKWVTLGVAAVAALDDRPSRRRAAPGKASRPVRKGVGRAP